MTIAVWAALLFTLGLYLTWRGGDVFVDSASFIAAVTGIPKIVIGATIISLATTAPELFVSAIATAHQMQDMAAGNAIGSVICNTGLIFALAIFFLPGRHAVTEIRIKGGLVLVACILLGIFCVDGSLSVREGLLLLLLLVFFFQQNIHHAMRGKIAKTKRLQASAGEKMKNAMLFVLGAAAVILGAHLMVENGATLARLVGIPESVIGLTLVAVGTSLPELITALTAIRHREGAMSVGNIIGANLIDLTFIPAICAVVSKGQLETAMHVAMRDVPMAIVLLSIALLPAMREGRFRRVQGVVLLALYAGYIGYLLIQ